MATIKIVRKEEEPKVVNLRDDMAVGQWGTGTFRVGAVSYDAVIALRRANGFSIFTSSQFEARYLGRYAPSLTITEILPAGTQVIITV